MSHLTTIQTQLKDAKALAKACEELKLEAPHKGEITLYDQSKHRGLIVQLPGWRYPICVKENGEIKYDNYNGAWGDIKHLNQVQQLYGVHKAILEARKKGFTTKRFTLPNGSIEVRIAGRL